MTAKCALAKAFLDGLTINVRNCFSLIGLTNAAREASRMIEKPFGVSLSRTQREGKSRYGQPVTWVDYRLLFTIENQPGIEKMKAYVKDQVEGINVKTDNEMKQLSKSGIKVSGKNHTQQNLF